MSVSLYDPVIALRQRGLGPAAIRLELERGGIEKESIDIVLGSFGPGLEPRSTAPVRSLPRDELPSRALRRLLKVVAAVLAIFLFWVFLRLRQAIGH